MGRSFASYAAPEVRKVRATAQDRNGAEIDLSFKEPSITDYQLASQFATAMIKKYVPIEGRSLVKPEKGDSEPVEFPAGPETGQIILTEQAVFELTNMFYFQVHEGNPMPWTEFVYMRQVAPECYKACQSAILELIKGDSPEGNQSAGPGSGLLGPRPADLSIAIPTS